MTPVTQHLEIAEFRTLIGAALTLAVAGLDGDPDWLNDNVKGSPFQFKIPYSRGNLAHKTRGGWLSGALHDILNDLCQRSGVVVRYESAYQDPDVIANDYYVMTVYAPSQASAHEVVAASALLEDGLARLGCHADYIEHVLTPR